MDLLRRRGRPELPDSLMVERAGQERLVRLEWRPRPPKDGRVRVRSPLATVLADAAVVVYGLLLGVPLLFIAMLLPRPADSDTPPMPWLWIVLAVLWAVFSGRGLIRMVRGLPDLRRRRIVEGTVVRHAVEARDRDTGALLGHSYYLGVDDGRRGTVTMHCTGFEPWGRNRPPGPNPYHSLRRGDLVRLVVAPGSAYVRAVQPLADADGGPPPSIPFVPAVPPGAPLTADQVAAGTSAAVRRVNHHHAGGADCVDVYVYHLIEDVPARLEVFVARSRTPVEDVRAAARAGDPVGAARADLPTRRYADGLLIGGKGQVAVGLRPPLRPDAAGAPYPSDVHLLNEAFRTVIPLRERHRA